jgi:Flp pilus assembly protein TadD
VGIRASNLGMILKAKGDLEGAQKQTERALRILEARLGPNNPSTQIARSNLESIRQARAAKQGETRAPK